MQMLLILFGLLVCEGVFSAPVGYEAANEAVQAQHVSPIGEALKEDEKDLEAFVKEALEKERKDKLISNGDEVFIPANDGSPVQRQVKKQNTNEKRREQGKSAAYRKDEENKKAGKNAEYRKDARRKKQEQE